MHRGVVIKINPGQVVPTDYLALAVKQFTTCMGMAVVAKHEGKPCLIVEHAMEAPTVDRINEIQTQFKDCNRMLFLGEFPNGALEDDIPPFRVIADGDEEIIAVMTDGEFVSFDKPGSNHSADFHLMETAVGPMLAKFYNQEAEGDLGKFHEIMNAPLQETVFNSFSANRGNIHVICADDKMHSYCKGELRKAFPWGITSQHLGFGEQATAADNKTASGTTDATPTKLNRPRLFGAGPKASDAPAIPAKMPTKTRPADAPIDEDAIKKKELEEKIAKDDHAWDSPPEKTRKNEGMTKAWYRTNSMDSKCPNNWKAYPPVRLKFTKAEWAKQQTQTKDLKDLPKIVEAAANRPGPEAMPIISADETKRLHSWLGEKKPKASTPDLQKMEKEVLPFSKAAGLSFDDIKGWDYGMKVELGTKVGVAALASMAHEFQTHTLTYEALHSKGDTKVADIVNTAKAVEPAAAAPTKKRLFG